VALPVAPAPGIPAAARTRPAEAGDTVVDFAAPTSARPAEKLALAARGTAMSLTYLSVLGVVVSVLVIQAPPGRPCDLRSLRPTEQKQWCTWISNASTSTAVVIAMSACV